MEVNDHFDPPLNPQLINKIILSLAIPLLLVKGWSGLHYPMADF